LGAAFHCDRPCEALADLGWTDGRNVRMDLRWASGDGNRIPALAQELVGLQPDIIVTSGPLATAAVQRETRTIPIVFAAVTEPVATDPVNGRPLFQADRGIPPQHMRKTRPVDYADGLAPHLTTDRQH
jgi:hypothetical protein